MSDDEAIQTDTDTGDATPSDVGGPYAWYVLVVLVIVYVFNFIDRGILSILAEDIKADLGVSDAQIGFLYGTAFAIFYAVFGIPLARLADMWTRRSLISIGLFFWSAMTALSGTSRSFFSLSSYRIGVGVGEASASPAAFSMLGDYFPPHMRATAVAVYSSGVYIGMGLGLFIGGSILNGWKKLYPEGGAPFDLQGWQVAFIAVGLPGVLMAAWVRSLREPKRGQTEDIATDDDHPNPFPEFMKEVASVLPPFTIWSLWKIGAGQRGITLNLIAAGIVALGAWGMTALVGDPVQWSAIGVGIYAVISWLQSLNIRDHVAFTMIFKSKAMVFAMFGFGFITFKTYGIGFWVSPFFLRMHDLDSGQVGTFIGLGSALGGWIGVTGGGIFSDWLKRRNPKARIYCGIIGSTFTVPLVVAVLYTTSTSLGYTLVFIDAAASSMWIGSAVAMANELVLPRMRATASSFYILMATFVGLALGPYTMGRISDAFIQNGAEPAMGLRYGMLIGMSPLILAIICFIIAGRYVTDEEANRLERARAAGETGI